jgi:hypothetical protein
MPLGVKGRVGTEGPRETFKKPQTTLGESLSLMQAQQVGSCWSKERSAAHEPIYGLGAPPQGYTDAGRREKARALTPQQDYAYRLKVNPSAKKPFTHLHAGIEPCAVSQRRPKGQVLPVRPGQTKELCTRQV